VKFPDHGHEHRDIAVRDFERQPAAHGCPRAKSQQELSLKCIEIPGRRQAYCNGGGLTIHLVGTNGQVRACPLLSSVGGGGQGVGNPPPLKNMFFVSWMLAGILVLNAVQRLRKIRVAAANFTLIVKILLDGHMPKNDEPESTRGSLTKLLGAKRAG
jgi:hypothetical protein